MIPEFRFLFQNKLDWEEAAPGIKRQILGFDQTIMTVKARFTTGAIGKLHHHPHAQTSYVASGKFRITIGETTKELVEGDGFYVPPKVVHGAVCLEAGLLIDSFSPYREDFLK